MPTKAGLKSASLALDRIPHLARGCLHEMYPHCLHFLSWIRSAISLSASPKRRSRLVEESADHSLNGSESTGTDPVLACQMRPPPPPVRPNKILATSMKRSGSS